MQPDTIQTLFCPSCGYNLTGLPDNRCPECGKAFDPVELRRRLAENAPQPITLRDTIWQIVWLPGLFLIAQGLALISQGALLLLPIVVGLIWLIYGAVIARRLAVRLAVSGGCDAEGKSRRGPWFIPMCAAGLYCCQIAIGAGPCAAISAFYLWK